MKIISVLEQGVINACQNLYGAAPDKVQIQLTTKDFEGQWTVVVFPLLRLSKLSPEKTGEVIGDFLTKNIDEVSSFNVVKGFLNLSITDSYWVEMLNQAHQTATYGFAKPYSQPLVLVEYSSPNTNKPLHLGHLRNNFLGYSVAEILKAAGHSVQKVQVINDRGIHICKSMVAWQKFGNGETPKSSGMKGDKLVGKYYVAFDKQHKLEINELVNSGISEEEAAKKTPILMEAQEMLRAWEQGDEKVYSLWQTMNGWVYEGFDATYAAMGVNFDKLYYESETFRFGKDEVHRGLEEGVFYQKEDGSIWVDLTGDGLDHKVLLRSDGTAVYMTQDIGTAIQRNMDYPNISQMVYTVGNEQEYHFKVLFLILQKLGYVWAKNCHHLSYGMVELPEGKMKSREGTVVDADDLMLEMTNTARVISEELGKLDELPEQEQQRLHQTIGLAALKYYLLKVDPRKNMLLDPRESIDFNGHTGPFIQYTHARICSLLRKSGEGVKLSTLNIELSENERNVLLKIDQYPMVIQEAAAQYNPAELSSYIYELVKDFNAFYQSVPVMKEENIELRQFRLLLSQVTARIINSGMLLLGIEVPERM
jgi:arginyl-tRNA synthetase